MYDPKNPDKAHIAGYTMEYDSTVVSGAIIYLLQSDKVLKTDTSDALGGFEIINIDPGIYKIQAKTRFFSQIEINPESLWASTDRIYLITFHTYHFEDDPNGAVSPYGFEPETGAWRVTDNYSNPSAHSVPHVYRGDYKDTAGFSLALSGKNLKNFFVKASVLVNDSSSAGWKVGLVFRYQNPGNYYHLQVYHDTVSFFRVLNNSVFLRKKKPFHFPAGMWGTMTLRCKEESTVCYINDIGQFMVLDSSFVNGQVGFWLSNENPDSFTSADFDDIAIYPQVPDTL
jgi:hypothetical protein